MVIIYKISAILFVYFLSGRKCKNTLPLPVKAKKGCFYARRQARRAASQTKSSRMGVKMSSRMPASVQTQPCSTPSSFRMVSPALTVWVTAVHREIERTRHHIGDLGVGVMVECARRPPFRRCSPHHIRAVGVGQHPAGDALACRLRQSLCMIDPALFLLGKLHIHSSFSAARQRHFSFIITARPPQHKSKQKKTFPLSGMGRSLSVLSSP